MKKLFWPLLLIIVFLVNCSQVEKYQKLDEILSKNEQRIDSVSTLSQKNRENIKDLKISQSTKNKEIESKLTAFEIMQSKIKMLENKIEVINAKIKKYDATIAELREVSKSDTLYTIPQQKTVEQIYNAARKLYKEGNYKESIEEFTKLLYNHPQHELASNAQYWIGECYYHLEQYETAMYNFDKVIQKFPESNKVVDAKLKIALCLIGMDEYQGALTQLKEIQKTHPDYERLNIVRERILWLENR